MAKLLDKIIIVDVESTCWENPKEQKTQNSEIIEIGLCTIDIISQEVENVNGIIIKPEYSTVSEFCSNLTSLTQEIVDKGINYLSATNQLIELYHSKQRAWISFGDYDRKMFINMSRLHKVPYPFGPTHINIKNLFALKMRLKKEVGLSRALEMIGEKFEGIHHRGKDDSMNIAKIVRHILYA